MLYRDQLKRQYNLGRFWLDIQLDDVSSFDEALAEKLSKLPAEYLPLVRLTTNMHASVLGFYMDSSSMLVLIGSHSRCNSFVVNPFLFFTPNGENSLCYRTCTPKKQ